MTPMRDTTHPRDCRATIVVNCDHEQCTRDVFRHSVIRLRRSAAMALATAVFLVFSLRAFGFDPPPPPPPPNLPPTIVSFVGTQTSSGWSFQGQVLDEDPDGLVITFGGLLNGHSTTVNDPNGNFQYTVQVQGSGAVTAHTTDDQGEGSNVAVDYI